MKSKDENCFKSVIVIAISWQATCLDWLPHEIDGPEKLSEKVFLILCE